VVPTWRRERKGEERSWAGDGVGAVREEKKKRKGERKIWAGLKRVERKGRGRRGKMGWAESNGREKEKLSNLATSNSIQI